MKCEDYALHTDEVALISDGCSGAPDTDWGSRLLCKAGVRSVENMAVTLQRATDAAKILDLSPESLFATYGYVQEWSDYVEAGIWGDGSIVVLWNDNSWIKYTIEFEDNTPEYPIYMNLPSISHDKQRTFQTLESHCHSIGLPIKIAPGFFKVGKFKDDIKAMYVFSDGIDSFIDVDTKQPISLERQFDLLEELLVIKVRTPQIIQRRCKRFFKGYCRRENIINTDDFSVGAYINV